MGCIMMEDMLSQDSIVGPLAEARENSELFADSILQQNILIEVVAALRALQLSPEADQMLDQVTRDQLDLLWTSIADEWYRKGISA